MLCYRDRWFCNATDCGKLDCDRNRRNKEAFHPDDFWADKICIRCGWSKECPDYVPESKED